MLSSLAAAAGQFGGKQDEDHRPWGIATGEAVPFSDGLSSRFPFKRRAARCSAASPR